MSDPVQDKPLPQRLAETLGADYTLDGEIGRGGMGVVYRARDNRLERRVAIKVLPPELAFNSEIRQRFTREAQTAAKLSHPHIVPIHAVGEGNSLVYFVMGYVDGESVAGRIRRLGRLPAEDVRRIAAETADALSAAHAFAIVHRDIKPDNILLDGPRARVMVTDFGIAKALSNTSHNTLTSAGVAIGTPSYMSPEQAAGEKEIDGRSDLYSLGVVVYQMLSGELPFQSPTVAGLLMKHITEPAPDVRTLRADVPEDLALAVARCLEKDPEQRWPSADALRRALETRTVSGYQPTGGSFRATQRGTRPAPGGGAAPRTTRSRSADLDARRADERYARGMDRLDAARDRALRRADERLGGARAPVPRPPYPITPRRDEDSGKVLVRDTGEPAIVQKVRQQFATWLAVNGGLFLMNIATTQLSPPWFLFPAAGMGIGLLSNYAKLWQAGYSWRDVLKRPPAPDSLDAALPGSRAAALAAPIRPEEFGTYYPSIQQMQGDREAIARLVQRLPEEERKMLPEIQPTADQLWQRGVELGRTLHLLDREATAGSLADIEGRLASLGNEPSGDERTRRIELLERQRKSVGELQSRRGAVQGQFESCVLAMQNLRLDLLKLKSANLQDVLGDITQATQAARAVSRNVDAALQAATEIKEAMRN